MTDEILKLLTERVSWFLAPLQMTGAQQIPPHLPFVSSHIADSIEPTMC